MLKVENQPACIFVGVAEFEACAWLMRFQNNTCMKLGWFEAPSLLRVLAISVRSLFP